MQDRPSPEPATTAPPAAATDASLDRLRTTIGHVFLGKPDAVDLAIVALLARGHILLEDIPGVGKTTLARVLAASVRGTFKRVQFTADLLPADVLGVSVYQAEQSRFVFQPGPVFTNVLVADEINRATPRTQSCLLEAMNEGQVSVDGQTHVLPQPFLVVATQNPLEYLGTYPLPESQLDRFLVRVRIGYPDRGTEREVLRSRREGDPASAVTPVLDADAVVALQARVREVRIEDAIEDYVLDIVDASRHHADVEVGLSPRGSLALMTAAQAHALLRGRDYVIPDDVKRLAPHVCAHRIVPTDGSATDAAVSEALVHEIVASVTPPR